MLKAATGYLIPQKTAPKEGPEYLIKLMKKMYQDDFEGRPDVQDVIKDLINKSTE